MTAPQVTAITDSLSADVPKLLSTGANWGIFCECFVPAVKAKGKWGHFDGTTTRPTAITSPPSAAEINAELEWLQNEATALNLLNQKLPDSTIMKIRNLATVALRWDAVKEEYTRKVTYAQTDMRNKFLQSKCSPKADVREFLEDLTLEKENLATYGVDISDSDYRSTIISAIPIYLSNYASSQLSSYHLFAPTDPKDLPRNSR